MGFTTGLATCLAFATAASGCNKSSPSGAAAPGEGSATNATASAPVPAAEAPALEGFEGEIDVLAKDKERPAPSSVALKIKNGKVRADIPEELTKGSGGPTPGYGIFDSTAKKVYLVMDKQKQVIVLDLNNLGERFGAGAPKVPGHEKDSKGPDAPPPKVTKTGKFDTVAGYKCENWDIESEHDKAQICVAQTGFSWLSFPMSALNGVPTKHLWMADLLDGKHLPLRFIGYEPGTTDEKTHVEVTKIDKHSMADGDFEYPPTYTVVDSRPDDARHARPHADGRPGNAAGRGRLPRHASGHAARHDASRHAPGRGGHAPQRPALRAHPSRGRASSFCIGARGAGRPWDGTGSLATGARRRCAWSAGPLSYVRSPPADVPSCDRDSPHASMGPRPLRNHMKRTSFLSLAVLVPAVAASVVACKGHDAAVVADAAPAAPPSAAIESPSASAVASASAAPAPPVVHHRGLVGMFFKAALEGDVTDDERDAIAKIEEPLRAEPNSRRELVAVHTDIIASIKAGKIDNAKLQADATAVAHTFEARQEQEAAALGQLHDALTPPQRKAVADAVRAAHEGNRESSRFDGGMPPDWAAHRVERMKAQLVLDEDQEKQVAALIARDAPSPAAVQARIEAGKKQIRGHHRGLREGRVRSEEDRPLRHARPQAHRAHRSADQVHQRAHADPHAGPARSPGSARRASSRARTRLHHRAARVRWHVRPPLRALPPVCPFSPSGFFFGNGGMVRPYSPSGPGGLLHTVAACPQRPLLRLYRSVSKGTCGPPSVGRGAFPPVKKP